MYVGRTFSDVKHALSKIAKVTYLHFKNYENVFCLERIFHIRICETTPMICVRFIRGFDFNLSFYRVDQRCYPAYCLDFGVCNKSVSVSYPRGGFCTNITNFL